MYVTSVMTCAPSIVSDACTTSMYFDVITVLNRYVSVNHNDRYTMIGT